jgi:hypothetical protein
MLIFITDAFCILFNNGLYFRQICLFYYLFTLVLADLAVTKKITFAYHN